MSYNVDFFTFAYPKEIEEENETSVRWDHFTPFFSLHKWKKACLSLSFPFWKNQIIIKTYQWMPQNYKVCFDFYSRLEPLPVWHLETLVFSIISCFFIVHRPPVGLPQRKWKNQRLGNDTHRPHFHLPNIVHRPCKLVRLPGLSLWTRTTMTMPQQESLVPLVSNPIPPSF